jgi:hypothetical protein
MTTKANPALGQSAGLGKMSGDQHDPPSIAPNRSGRQDPSANFPTPDEPAPPAAMRNGHAVETYDPRAAFEWAYVDESGAPLFRSIRRPEKQFWQSPADGKGGWVKPAKGCMDGVRLVPLYLPEVLAAIRNSGLIFIAEGERKADLLRHWGFVATCNSSGAARSPKLSSCRIMTTRGESTPIRSAPLSPPSAEQSAFSTCPGSKTKRTYSTGTIAAERANSLTT